MNKTFRNSLALSLTFTATCAGMLGTAQAQTVVYGIVDAGIEYVTNVNAAGDSATRMPSITGSYPSRIGFRGTEDLGGGLQVVYVLENGFATDSGTVQQGGRLFGRQANVGIKSAYGTVTVGRQHNMTYMSILKADVMGPNIHAIGSLDGYLPNARSDNAVGYMGTFNGVTVGATYSLGRDATTVPGGPAATVCAGEVAGNSKACRQVTALLAYDSSGYGITGAYDILYGNAGAAGGLTSSNYHDERSSLNGYVMLGTAKLGLGTVQRKIHTAVDTKSALYYLGVSYPFGTAWVLDAQAARLDIRRSPNDSTLLTARMSYKLSKRSSLYASLGHMDNNGAAAIAVDAGGTIAPGNSQNGLMLGMRHHF